MGPSEQIQIEHNIVKNPKCHFAEGKPISHLHAWLGPICIRSHRETIPGSDHSGTRTRDRWIASSTC